MNIATINLTNKNTLGTVAMAVIITFSILCSATIMAAEIALTFDDAPLGGSAFMSGDEKTDRIIQHLKDHKVPDALFFVTTSNISAKSESRLKRYTDAGYHLANHSHKHLSANKVKPQEYLADFEHSLQSLKAYDNVLKLHRFPYLHYGNNKEARVAIFNGLQKFDYDIGYTTVDNYEWYVNSKAVNEINNGNVVDMDQLKKLYIETLWQSILFYDDLAIKTLKRSPKHVLLLHENEMAALFLGDLITFLHSKGWKIISPQEAYTDRIAHVYDPSKMAFNNQGRVAAIAHLNGTSIEDLRHPSENIEFLDKEFKRMNIVRKISSK